MNATAASAVEPRCRALAEVVPTRIALLGTGTVGRAVMERLADWAETPWGESLSLVYAANSRAAVCAEGGLHSSQLQSLALVRDGCASLQTEGRRIGSGELIKPASMIEALGNGGVRVIIDATASEAVAECHGDWLQRGFHVVTASKLGQGGSLRRWRSIHAACARGHTQYGDSATVGAGLPLLRTIRELQRGGDRIHAIAGVLSGSMAWLFHHYDGLRSFSSLVREARDAGYTEPDPRDDLSGEDVRRKLLILARAAGVALDAVDVELRSLVPPDLARMPIDEVDAGLRALDGPLHDRKAEADNSGGKLHFIARLDGVHEGSPTASVGLETLVADHPLAGGSGTDNRIVIWSDRYRDQPILIQGPGAGAGVTAAALLDDVLRITRLAKGASVG
jgi:homoserine dehydrogenase